MNKICKQCAIDKPLTEYYKFKGNPQALCMLCYNERYKRHASYIQDVKMSRRTEQALIKSEKERVKNMKLISLTPDEVAAPTYKQIKQLEITKRRCKPVPGFPHLLSMKSGLFFIVGRKDITQGYLAPFEIDGYATISIPSKKTGLPRPALINAAETYFKVWGTEWNPAVQTICSDYSMTTDEACDLKIMNHFGLYESFNNPALRELYRVNQALIAHLKLLGEDYVKIIDKNYADHI